MESGPPAKCNPLRSEAAAELGTGEPQIEAFLAAASSDQHLQVTPLHCHILSVLSATVTPTMGLFVFLSMPRVRSTLVHHLIIVPR